MSRDIFSSAAASVLREAFDTAFSRPVETSGLTHQRFVLCVAGGKTWAFALEAMEGVVRSATIATMPSALAGYAGLVGVRSRLYPAWFLSSLMGQGVAPAASNAPAETLVASLILCRSEEPLALVVERVDGLVKIPTRLLQPSTEQDASLLAHVTHRLPWASAWHPVVSLPSVLQTLRSRAGTAGKEPSHHGQ